MSEAPINVEHAAKSLRRVMHRMGEDRSGFILEEARRVVRHEANVLVSIGFGESFVYAVDLLLQCKGRVVVMGVGKSGIVAERIAATLSVSGAPAWALQGADAVHGDMGRLVFGDVLLLVSRSGESRALVAVLDFVQERLGSYKHVFPDVTVPVIVITSRPDSTLAKRATTVLLHPGEEACEFGLTVTSTATAASVLGDALALVLQKLRKRTRDDFLALHGDGNLGRRLTVQVQEVMVVGEAVGRLRDTDTLLDAMLVLARKRGTVVVATPGGVEGVITAGDVARYMDGMGEEMGGDVTWETEPVANVMTKCCHWVRPRTLVADAISEMQETGIMAMPVISEDNELVGMIHLHDALRARVQ